MAAPNLPPDIGKTAPRKLDIFDGPNDDTVKSRPPKLKRNLWARITKRRQSPRGVHQHKMLPDSMQPRHQKGWDELEYEAEEMIKRALDQQSLQIYEQCPMLTQHKLDKPESKENAADADSHSTNEPGDGPAQHLFTAQISSSPQQTPNPTRLTEAPRSNRTPIPKAIPHINTDVNIAISTSISIKVQDSILDHSDYQHGKTYLPDANKDTIYFIVRDAGDEWENVTGIFMGKSRDWKGEMGCLMVVELSWEVVGDEDEDDGEFWSVGEVLGSLRIRSGS
ncbi:uncharacterized protein RAG0_06937 [Rhynchosporium agropyri]|uniref:Uncharacterized protein n=1 Tax=Rhynchosporium agropyri TaxID=914238 RepID=A0A1E1KJ84_9HELO|nr:uncharacterized protein RAG0_06937 [Rhynchosporium agropyri]